MQETPGFFEKLERIVFMGFMGAGKSTVGMLLAQRLGWRFVDADHHIESRTGLSVAELFAQHGEAGFRRMEADVVAEVLREKELVLALGGGAVETASTYALLKAASETCLIFLDAPLPMLILRCQQEPGAAVRPILKNREQLQARWKTRLPLYQQAHLTVNTAGLTPERVVDFILDSLRRSLFNSRDEHSTKKEVPR